MRYGIKTSTLLFFFILRTVRRIFYRDPEISVLMYHSIDDTDWKYGVTQKVFERQMGYLKRNYNVVSLMDIIDYIKGRKTLAHKSVAITFDDGYEDTYTKAYPTLKHLGLQATLFLTTDLERKQKLGNLPRPSWDQVQEMSESGVMNIEVHGHTHTNWTDIDESVGLLDKEIEMSRDLIEEHTGVKPYVAAYPAGRRSTKLEHYLNKREYAGVCGIREGLIRRGDNVFAIKRIQVDRTIGFLLFKMRLTKALDYNRAFIDWWRRVFKGNNHV